ncbi:MAG: hypothetical protein N4A41_09370 [Crocinitomicaceae bacterium]|nr:hypothetical protein [Crocinitomicaceae bacterium]
MIKLLYVLFIGATMSSCFHLMQGVHQDYQFIPGEERWRVEKLDAFSNCEKGKVYEITGKQLRTELKKNDTSVVSLFVNKCSGVTCYPMSVYSSYAQRTGRKVYMIMCDYGNFKYTMDQSPEIPLFSVNADHYKTDYQRRYNRRFFKDLLATDDKKQVDVLKQMDLIFKGDSLIGYEIDIFSIK